jgi:hypothetical protein
MVKVVADDGAYGWGESTLDELIEKSVGYEAE